MTNLLQFTINVPKPCSLRALYNSFMKIACRSSELIFTFLFAGICIQNASEQFVWCILSFANFTLHPTPTGRTLLKLGLKIQTAVTRQQFTITRVFI